MNYKKNLLLLYDRPREPIFMGKGKSVFDVPDNYLTDRYRPIGPEIQNRFGELAEERIPVRSIALPDLRIPMSLGRQEQFSLFIPRHRKIAARLIDIFMGMRNIEELQSCAVFARDRINPYLFNYALSVALLHRRDTKNLDLPSVVEVFPDKYVDSRVFEQIREEATVVPEGMRMPIVIPKDFTASDLDEEHRLWYFREDIGVNLHHWHWHLVYPGDGPDSVVRKDRRGELFYYMHSQLIARYNFERFCNRLQRVKRLNNLREPIAEGYFPKLDSLVASRTWPGRVDNAVIKDLNRELDQIKQDVSDLERWIDRIYEAVHQGYVVDESGNRIFLDEEKGIDILGNIIESSILSPNRQLYGDMHNVGHVFLSYTHDPDHRHLESFGVMGDVATAMRDPVFYRWHSFIDDIFQEHKIKLPAYTKSQLTYEGISVTGIIVQSEGAPVNTLHTYWQQSDVDLSRGMDFVPRGNVFARFTHLQHAPFQYVIQIDNTSDAQRMGFVRIFMAPKNDERGQPMLFRDQRLFMVEMDKFLVALRPGANRIRRRSNESTVTIPFERTFRNLDDKRPETGTPEEEAFNFCGCGWPAHMLVPKGLPEGFPADLFVMVSNYEDDRVVQDLVGTCNDAASYCGVRDRLYPDRKAMGFPFDRLARTGVDRLSNFVTPNMAIQSVNVIHIDKTVPRT
uniref:TK receptor n=1 Tax=Aedes aegypti TaxID=7159 RepID=UPI00295295B7|nr:Chain A, TK receptor [Aedes aegypti]8JI8_B Chain B, TK receptor [Aedes aegypti]8JI8_C Chain C, TK receptor [Aedes aegypti]8JI8_D Chain D, TK receptor [Aedes aegypti]